MSLARPRRKQDRNHERDARDFNNIETRDGIKFFFSLQGKVPKKIHAILAETLGEHALSYTTVENWVAHRVFASSHKLVYLGFQCLDHPPYSPYLNPSDYHLLPGLKIQLKSPHFSSDAEVNDVSETWLDGQFSDFFLSGLQKLEQWAKKCIELRGEYVE